MNAEEANRLVTSLYDSRYAGLVRFATRYVGSVDTAEDLVQETFMDLYRALRTGTKVKNVAAWASCVVRRKIFRELDAANSREKLSQDVDCERLAAVNPAPAEDYDRWGREVRELFHVLSRREEEVIVLRLSGMKYREIAKELGISPNSVNALLSRALRKLQAARKAGIESKPVFQYAAQDDSRTLH